MKVEEIAIRQEVRQMLNEAGINKNTLKDMVKEVLMEEVSKATKQAINETDIDSYVQQRTRASFDEIVKNMLRDEIKMQVRSTFSGMRISVDITDNKGTSSISW